MSSENRSETTHGHARDEIVPREPRGRLQARPGLHRAPHLSGGGLLFPNRDRPGKVGRPEEQQHEIPVVPGPGAQLRAGTLRGRPQDVRAGRQARVLRRRHLLQPGHRLPAQPAARSGVRRLPARPGPAPEAPPDPRGAVALRAPLLARAPIPGPRSRAQRPVRPAAGPPEPAVRPVRRQRGLKDALGAFTLGTALLGTAFLLMPGPAATSATAGPREDLRETRSPAAASYLRHALLALDRPRPEDQEEARRLFRKALAADPGLAAAHAGLSRSAVYVYSLGIDDSVARLEEGLEEAKLAVAGDPS